jgi:hypothetical protein
MGGRLLSTSCIIWVQGIYCVEILTVIFLLGRLFISLLVCLVACLLVCLLVYLCICMLVCLLICMFVCFYLFIYCLFVFFCFFFSLFVDLLFVLCCHGRDVTVIFFFSALSSYRTSL